MNFRILKYVLICFTFSSINSQNITLADTIYCNYLGQEHGLLQLNIKAMAQDKLGYLWAGTEDGLHRFNGYSFKPYVYNPEDSTTIQDDHIRGLQFENDTLWIATNTKGIHGFIPSQNKFFKAFGHYKNKDLNTGHGIFKLKKDVLLYATKNHLFVLNTKSNSEIFIPLENNLIDSHVTGVERIYQDIFWIGTSASGVLEFNYSRKTLKALDILQTEEDITLFKHNDLMFFGTKSGLFEYDVKTGIIIKTTLSSPVNCFYKMNNWQVYIGTKNGLYILNVKDRIVTPIVLQTNNKGVYKTIDINTIIGDDKGNTWIGTEANGIFHINDFQKKFSTIKLTVKEYPNIKSISAFQILKDKDSTLWLGSKYGVIKYSPLNKQFKLYKTQNNPLIYTLVRDYNSTIWSGGFTSGLLKYNLEKDIFESINVPNLPDKDIVEIIPIDKNTLWLCTWSGGIYKYNIKSNQINEIQIDGNRLNRARISLVDSKDNIWLGTDSGVFKVTNKGEFQKHYDASANDKGKISNDRIFSIKEDADGNIWFGTGAGLTKLDLQSEETTLYYKQKGLPNDFIYNILIENQGKIWVSTNFGLSVLDTKTETFKNYTVNDGLQNNEFNGKCAFKDEYGNFYFCGIGGINIFNPDQIIENPHLPEIYIESVELFNEPILKNELFAEELEFKHNQNVLTFNFAALNYLNSEKCNYTYMMEGFDNDWRAITKNRSTTYTNLDPGTYTFKVKASNDVGLWNEIPDTLRIIIIPPWYKTLGFRIMAVLLFLLSGFLFYRYKTRKLKQDKLKLELLVEERTKEIQVKNKDLTIAYKKADKQRKNITFLMRELTHRVKNNLQIISSLLNIQANNIENLSAVDALKVAKNRILTISHIENKMVNKKEDVALDSFIKDISNSILTALSDDGSLKFKVVYKLVEITAKNVNTTLIGLILNELITNTTKYAFDNYNPNNKLEVSCSLDKNNTLKLIIQDNGKGYDVEEQDSKNSLGLELVNEMVEQLNGTIHINSTNGAKNTIKIPL